MENNDSLFEKAGGVASFVFNLSALVNFISELFSMFQSKETKFRKKLSEIETNLTKLQGDLMEETAKLPNEMQSKKVAKELITESRTLQKALQEISSEFSQFKTFLEKQIDIAEKQIDRVK